MTTSSKLNFRSCQPKDILTNRTVNLFQDRANPFENILIASVGTISLSADILIVSENTIRVSIRRKRKRLLLSILCYTDASALIITTFYSRHKRKKPIKIIELLETLYECRRDMLF